MDLRINKKYLNINKKLIPGGKVFDKVNLFELGQTPFSFHKASGSYVWDVDNNKYLDFTMSLGTIILGYANKRVIRGINKQLSNGISFSLTHPLEISVAKKLIKMIPCAEMVRFGKNGSDVLGAAVRLSRHITKRDHVMTCGWHGIHDWSLSTTSRPGGIPERIRKLSHKFEFNNIDSVNKIIRKYNNKISCIVMDLCARYYPQKNFLQDIREIAKKNKIILIFDEIITGFRMHPGGAQSYFNVIPDLACFGKGIANGMPLSALVGKRELMQRSDELFYSLTFAGETLSLAAANTTLDIYKNMSLSKNLAKKGRYLINGLNEIINKKKLNKIFFIEGMDSRPILSIGNNQNKGDNLDKEKKRKILLFLIKEFAKQNILFNGSIFISNTHTKKNLNRFLHCFSNILNRVKKIT